MQNNSIEHVALVSPACHELTLHMLLFNLGYTLLDWHIVFGHELHLLYWHTDCLGTCTILRSWRAGSVGSSAFAIACLVQVSVRHDMNEGRTLLCHEHVLRLSSHTGLGQEVLACPKRLHGLAQSDCSHGHSLHLLKVGVRVRRP
jgi:hypothetical protein